MERPELLREVYNHVASIRKPFERRDTIEDIRYLLRMVEDGCLTWKEIKEHLQEGCPCEEVTQF